MKKILIILMLLFSTNVFAADSWTTADIQREVAWEVLHYVDWMQTRQIARQPYDYHEVNPMLGSHPSLDEVNRYMIGSAILHPVVAHYLPDVIRGVGLPESWAENSRSIFQYVTIGVSGGCVANNFNIGLKISF